MGELLDVYVNVNSAYDFACYAGTHAGRCFQRDHSRKPAAWVSIAGRPAEMRDGSYLERQAWSGVVKTMCFVNRLNKNRLNNF
jgi:hypothetical protein